MNKVHTSPGSILQNKRKYPRLIVLPLWAILTFTAYYLFMIDADQLSEWQLNLLTVFYLTAIAALSLWLLKPVLLAPSWIAAAFASYLAARREQAATQAEWIINQPELKTPLLRGIETLIALSAWSLFFYFLQSLVTAIAWNFGFSFLSRTVFFSSSLQSTLSMLSNALWFAVFIFTTLYAWAQWNYWRYGRRNRRKAKPAVTNNDMALYFQLSETAVKNAQQFKIACAVPTETGIEIRHE